MKPMPDHAKKTMLMFFMKYSIPRLLEEESRKGSEQKVS
mgnify:CR=1 FL=1